MAYFYDRAGDLVRRLYDRRISGPSVVDMATYFPEGVRFAGAWHDIRAEALSLASHLQDVPRFHDVMPEQAAISANDGRDWHVFLLKAYGLEFPGRLAACPKLAGLLDATPAVVSATLSFMAPHKHIPAHRGPFRGVLRYYLVLSMPRAADGGPAAVLRVDGVDHRLGDGEDLLWDDTYEHEVWNDSDSVRIVLLLDVWRPGMPVDMELLSRVIASGVRMGIRWRGLG